MMSRRHISIKAGATKNKAPCDVTTSISLPPLVEGELRCFLRVTVGCLLWSVAKPPPVTSVRLRWWGESSDGTHFHPRNSALPSQKSVRTTARFPVRCGPKQFTAYLADMGNLVLEVLSKQGHLPIARAQVKDISCLSQSQPITGFHTLMSPTSKKLGEVEVSLHLEPLAGAFENRSSSILTNYITSSVPQVPSMALFDEHPAPDATKSDEGGDGNTLREEDQIVERDESLENLKLQANCQNTVDQPNNDILSASMECGNKLRDTMATSDLESDKTSIPVLKDFQLPTIPSEIFFENILLADSAVKQSEDNAVVDCGLGCSSDMDGRAVELLLGYRSKTSVPPLWQGEADFFESPSSHGSLSGDSELGDPQYDNSLLENLFYKTTSESRAEEMAGNGERQKNGVSQTEKRLKQSATKSRENPVLELQGDLANADIPLNLEQLAFLSFMRSAKVTVDSMSVPKDCASPPSVKTPCKSPSLLRRKKTTYFVEYAFPKTSSSNRPARNLVPGVDVTRAASSNVAGGVVSFHQLSMFPVRFSKTTVKRWWASDLLFRIFARKHDQNKAVLIGEVAYPLRCLLQSQQLSESLTLPVHAVEGAKQELCVLRVLLQLCTNHGVSETSEKRDSSSSRSPQRESSTTSQFVDIYSNHLTGRSSEDIALNVPLQNSMLTPYPTRHTPPDPARRLTPEEPEVLLHTLLMVPDGKNFNSGPAQAVNVYLSCKLFWCDEVVRSVVSWGRANPSFNFVQVTPVALTPNLLERMKNNLMVIEVWQKTSGSSHERLLGLVKLPLHQFYMSFRDSQIAHLLLQAQYPVLGVDCYMPVVDVFSGGCRGSLRVTLAMGLCEQVLALQRARDNERDSPSHPSLRRLHLLDHQPSAPAKVITSPARAMTEHVFTIQVEKVSGLTPLQSTVWGEADCYIQYTFPCQEVADFDTTLDGYSNTNLKPFRTTTTLCVPDPLFGHTETHALLVPEGVPVQKLLLSSLSSQGLRGGGGVNFEVWCRYYYPNVRDQLVAKGILPLSKLCAMVTMQGRHLDDAEKFSLPLLTKVDGLPAHQLHSSGLLDVCIRYKYRPMRVDKLTGRGAACSSVTLVVQVHRGCGLQAAARVIAQQDERFDYFATVGVNSYVSVHLSMLPDDEPSCTRVAARTFWPEFDHRAEMRCDLLVHKSGGETCSLAERLAEASAVFTVWNKDNRKGVTATAPDVMLGTVKIPLIELLHKTTGISGWFSISAKCDSLQRRHTLVGGLEISVGFAHHSERERVIHAAEDLGWDLTQAQIDCDDQGAWELSTKKLSITFSMPRAWLPLHCFFLPGHDTLQRSTYCYLRYRFYDHDTFCSHMKHPCVGDDKQATVMFQGSRTVELNRSQALLWYLREEKLEVQVWVAFQKDKSEKPRDTDRLLGSAFIDLSSFAKAHQPKLTISGVYPLFRRSAADLQGAALRVHLGLTSGCVPTVEDDPAGSDSQEETLVEGPLHPTPPSSPNRMTQSQTTPDDVILQPDEINEDESFPATVVLHRAKNLDVNINGQPPFDSSTPAACCFISYVTANTAEPVTTPVVADTNCPIWDHQHDTRLSKQLLLDPQQSLVFKVLHKNPSGAEQVIGFTSVDLSPLLCGLQSLCGWYNVVDFSGHCRGQLKLAVTPLKWVQDLRGHRKAALDREPLSQVASCSYQTTGTYNSFPSHVSRFPEQHISSPDHREALTPKKHPLTNPVPSESERHHEHMQKVRLHHQSLQEQATPHSSCDSISDVNPSGSLLFSTIRKIMSDQDNIQRYFSSKLTSPTFPPASVPDEQKQAESNEDRLLVTSQHFADDVHNGHHQQAISSIIHCSPAKENHSKMLISSSCPRSCFPTSQSEEEQDSGHREENVVDDEECKSHFSSEEEEEDYEEEVLEPRHLNEIMFSPVKTTPWNSILSEQGESLTKPSEEKDVVVQRHRANSLEDLFGDFEEASNSPSDDDNKSAAASEAKSTSENQVSLPNFFLPSHQLEASLKVVHLAPLLSSSSSDAEGGLPPLHIPHKGRWRCPSMSPTSRRRETERFARICATRLDDDD
ncbi:C2 domain-containing protein 3-like isoform X1 [Corythoichthys intestinalis]|uniref:C2 domain-containing protein 3-like isoform X1 n=1 Tax=Corythoichthys intestinalis TaxID=161448 RepID=UPI0025A5FBA0|nr:C2 domain-containing protein 3-like isoform X1 [Corythoichthys intestinalis]